MINQCKWCQKDYSPRIAGRKQIFCSPKCRKVFEKKLRAWALLQEERGKVDLEILVLKKGD